MESGSDLPKRNEINQHLEEFPSSSLTPTSPELDPSLMPDFPNELVIEILSRLPVKSLGKFKSVSRPWLSLISSPRFIETHLAVASGRDDYGHQRLMFTTSSSNGDRRHELHFLTSLLHEPTSEATLLTSKVFDVHYPLNLRNNPLWLAGSCNGLVCIYEMIGRSLFLCNPCLKKSMKLPDTAMNTYWKNFGFGYDKLNHDYKLVGLYRTLIAPKRIGYKIVVYSLKNHSWHKVKNLTIGISEHFGQLENLRYANEKFHWPTSDGIDNWKIASFGLSDEVYGELDRPNNRDGLSDHGLGVLGGCLSVLYEYGRTCTDIWIMKDYGVNESWTKFVSIPYVELPHEASFMVSQTVSTSWNGEILFILHSNLLLYNPNTNTFKSYPQIGLLDNVVRYVESLVLPDTQALEKPTAALKF